MQQVNMHEAKTHLSRLVQAVAAGQEVVIAKAGKPVAKLVPFQADSVERTPGIWRGKVKIADDFDSLPPALQAAFMGDTE